MTSGRTIEGFSRLYRRVPQRDLELYVTTGRGQLPSGGSLLIWEFHNPEDFLLETDSYAVGCGAANLLTSIDQQLARGEVIPSEQILFCGGGSGVAVAPTEHCQTIARRLHELFARVTLTTRCIVAFVDLVSGEEGFAQRFQAAREELSRVRAVHSPGDEPLVPFFVQRCGLCHRRAAGFSRKRTKGRRFECLHCAWKIDAAKTTLGEPPDDFETVADARGYVGVLCLSGNGVEKAIQALRSPLQLTDFGEALREIYSGAFQEVAGRYGLAQAEFRCLPYVTGDSLVAVVPGAMALPLTRDLLLEIERRADAHADLRSLPLQEPLGAAAGVALGKLECRIPDLLTEAEALFESAKRRVYRESERSVLDFAVTTDDAPADHPKAANHCLPTSAGMPTIVAGGRPYELREFERFSRRLHTFRSTPLGKNQLDTVYRIAGAGPHQLRSYVLFQVARREEWRQLISDLAGDPGAYRDPSACIDQLIPRYGGRPVFDLGDILDLYDHWREPGPVKGRRNG